MNFGDFEGKPWNSPEFLYIHKNPFLKFPAGESFAQVAHRAYSIIEDVKDKHTGAGNILCLPWRWQRLFIRILSLSAEEFIAIGN
nr:histidine phosphatase family protein [Treponema sp. OMZ 803]